MRTKRFAICALLAFAPVLPSVLQAAPVPGQGTWERTLQPRDIDGDGVVDAFYDTVLGISWLADANAGAGSRYDSSRYSTALDGRMNWSDATAWAAALDVHGVTGWRLPDTVDSGRPGCEWSDAGGTDCGHNVLTISADGKTVYSEMAHLFYATLGNLAECAPGHSPCQKQWPAGAYSTGDFRNVEWFVYWSGSPAYGQGSPGAWSLDFRNGIQDLHSQPLEFQAWAVRDGDVPNAAPEPGALALGLLALAAAARASRRVR